MTPEAELAACRAAMLLTDAQPIADRIVADLAPYCEPGRCVVAGSVRRRKPEVGDIEVVCIPRRVSADWFSGGTVVMPEFARAVDRWPAVKGVPSGKYTQRRLPEGINLDLFMATADNWGLILAIRTGSRRYSHEVLARGWCANRCHSVDGYLCHVVNGLSKRIPVPEESDLFRLAGVPWVEPEART
jgi:DNA polymerase (family 10)